MVLHLFVTKQPLELLVLETHGLVEQAACALGEQSTWWRGSPAHLGGATGRAVCTCRCCVPADRGQGDSLRVFRSVRSILPPGAMMCANGRPPVPLTRGTARDCWPPQLLGPRISHGPW